jgi:hypothetical protein
MRMLLRNIGAALIASSALCLAGSAGAAPLSQSLALHNADNGAMVETVQWRRHGGWGRGGWGRGGGWVGPAVGLAAGALIGSALAAPYYAPYAYGPAYSDYGYSYAPGYYGYSPGYTTGYSARAAVGGGDVAYCEQRFKSYDPASGTYLGYDGRRHPCP